MRAPFTQLFIHLVWSTWDREPWITKDIEARLHAAIARRCIQLKCDPVAVGGVDDHLHLLVRLHPAVAIAELVKEVKGSSSHLMNHEIRPGGEFRWQGAYGAFSLRKEEVEQVKGYILNQAKHHADHTVFDYLEETEVSM